MAGLIIGLGIGSLLAFKVLLSGDLDDSGQPLFLIVGMVVVLPVAGYIAGIFFEQEG